MKSKSAFSIVVTSFLLVNVSFANSVKPATNAMARMSEPKSAEMLVCMKLKNIMLPEVNIHPPATLADAIDFLRQASRDHDDPAIPEEQRGVNLILKLPQATYAATGVPRVPGLRLRWVSLFDTLKLVCDLTGMEFLIKGNIIMVVSRSDPSAQVQTHSDQILQAMQDQENKSVEQLVSKKLKSIVIPEVIFRSPATLVDAINFFWSASRDYDDPEIPLNQRGVNLVLTLGLSEPAAAASNDPNDPFAATYKTVPVVHTMSARNISLFDALKLVCDVTDTKFRIIGNIVRIVPNFGGEDIAVPKRSDKILPTVKDEQTMTPEQLVNQKLKTIVLPEVSFRAPATLVDAVEFFKQASRDHDDPKIPEERRGVNFILKLAPSVSAAPASATTGLPVIPAMSARSITLYDALKLVCDVTGMKFRIIGNIVMIVPRTDSDAQVPARSTTRVPPRERK